MPIKQQRTPPLPAKVYHHSDRNRGDATLGKAPSASLGGWTSGKGNIHVLRNKSVNVAADPLVLGLQLLAHVVADEDLGARFLALTGLDADDLRARAADPGVLAALVDFVAANEADLVAAAAALGEKPEAIIAAGLALSNDA